MPTLIARSGRISKKEVCEFYGYKCQCCGVKKKSNLHLHHKHYKTFGSESMDDVELLCMKCHNLLHKKGREVMLARGEQVKADRQRAKQLKKAKKIKSPLNEGFYCWLKICVKMTLFPSPTPSKAPLWYESVAKLRMEWG